MKKSKIYVVIDSEEKRLRALEILERAGEKVYENSYFLKVFERKFILSFEIKWGTCGLRENKITLDQLEQLLIPMSELDQLKQQAEALGYELVENKREIKVGDFGVFWDGSGNFKVFDFLKEKHDDNLFIDGDNVGYENFRHLTEEEKQQIQNNW